MPSARPKIPGRRAGVRRSRGAGRSARPGDRVWTTRGPSHAPRCAFAREDCGKHVARAVLRKAAPLVGDYKVCDVVCYRRKNHGLPTAPRIVGIDGPKTAWLVYAGGPRCAAIGRLRPATGPEAVAMQHLAEAHRFAQAPAGEQQGFVAAHRASGDDAGDDDVGEAPTQHGLSSVADMDGGPSRLDDDRRSADDPTQSRSARTCLHSPR